MEGSHIRLRLLPAVEVHAEKIKQIAEQTIAAYLKRRPALFAPDPKTLAPLYKAMFISEYGEGKWREKYGEDGTMSIRPNNSFHYIEYEPEYHRYGGAEGVKLAEWHFDHSSDIIVQLLRDVNVRVPSMLLGISVQLSLPLYYGFFENDQDVMSALDGYIDFWQNTQGGGRGWSNVKNIQVEAYDKYYQRMAAEMQKRILEIKEYMTQERTKKQLTPVEYAWKSHILELRQRVDALFAQGKMEFEDTYEGWLPGSPEHHKSEYRRLLGSYVHMTNNRLGVSILHEVYLSYLSKRSLEDLTLSNQGVRA